MASASIPQWQITAKNGHSGLQGMRQRVARVGGKLQIVSSPNSGTEVTVVVPGAIVFGRSRTTLLNKIKNVLP
jgi:signal transduction histidine kinase